MERVYTVLMILFIISFVAGLLTVLAPCILPLLPVILAGSVSETSNRRRPFIIIGSLSLSVLVFTLLLKGSTALITISPSFWTYVSAVILAAFGLTLLFPIAWARIVLKIPGHNKPDRWISKGYGEKESVWSDVVVGAALGPVFTTCSPTFFVILATVLPQSLAMGIVDLAAYIIGLALSLLLIAALGQKLIGHLDWATNPNGLFRKILGVIFVVIAVAIAFGFDKKIEANILASGFFDVTKIEQKISESLQSGFVGSDMSDRLVPPTEPGATSTVSGFTPAPPAKLAPGATRSQGKYTELVNIAGYINTGPIKLADLAGKKVILVDFIDYSCINCQRTFPYMNDWYKKYKNQGLEIVAIHTPEFAFERNIENVRKGINEFGLKFPIVLDNDYSTWNAYRNSYWPHKYLIDIKGNVVYDHAGEGAYDETEKIIVDLLNERKKALGESDWVKLGSSSMPAPDAVQAASPETYFGAERNERFGNGAPSMAGQRTFDTPAAGDLTPNLFYLGGTWDIEKEYAQNMSAGATLSYTFTASKMYIVAENADGSAVTAKVLIDGREIPDQWAGADVKSGTLTIDGSRLYGLYANPVMGRHRIDIIFAKPGVKAYTFTFG